MICDITLFNRYTLQHEFLYQRTYLYKVEWGEPKLSAGQPSRFSTIIQIPGIQLLNYKVPRNWNILRTEFWTVQPEDVIVKGIVDVNINTVTVDERNLYSLTDLKKNFDTVTVIDITFKGDSISQQTINIGAS